MTSGAKTNERHRHDPGLCPRCGEAMLPRLTGTARSVGEDGPLCAESPVRMTCPTCG